MNKIISKEHFSEKVFKLVVEAPLIAKSRKAGHFVIVRVGEKGERMPLTIAGADPVKGTITLVVQEVGLSSTRLCELNEGDYITDVVGRWEGYAYRELRYGGLCRRRCRRGSDVAYRPGFESCGQPGDNRTCRAYQGTDYPGKGDARKLGRGDYHDR